MYDKDSLSAFDAVSLAQWLAFAPLAFQATVIMRDQGFLSFLAGRGKDGATIDEVVAACGMSPYAVRVLLEAGLGMRIVWRQDDRFRIGKLGRILLEDEMTRVNLDFMRDVCYQPAAHLKQSLVEGRAAGLHELGPWGTLYEGLSSLPEPALSSWHAFDHFYSDRAFPAACARLAAGAPARILDVGCNTGRWAEYCLQQIPQLSVGLVDLPQQLERARERLGASDFQDRVEFHPIDLLDSGSQLPGGYDLIWMSQFLDCFSDDEVVAILTKARAALPSHGRIWILELFWDRQRFEAAAFSLQQTSLYFSCVANGNSQMYDSAVFLPLVEQAGLVVSQQTDAVGGFHTLLECRPAL